MCMIDDCEPWTVHHDETRKAAKDHRCDECRRTISKGETYEHGSGLCDGRWTTQRTCEHCVAARSWLLKVCSGWVYGMVADDLREHWWESPEYRSLWLGRAIHGIGHQWKRPDGTLRDPLPEFPGLLPHESVPTYSGEAR